MTSIRHEDFTGVFAMVVLGTILGFALGHILWRFLLTMVPRFSGVDESVHLESDGQKSEHWILLKWLASHQELGETLGSQV